MPLGQLRGSLGSTPVVPPVQMRHSSSSAVPPQMPAQSRRCGVMPVVLGGDHSIGFPTIRGLAPYMDGNVGIIHFDRHVDTQETDLDERMHTTPWFHATNIKNAPATNLVQIGIGGWQAPRAGVKVGRERKSTVITVGDVGRVGVEKIAEMGRILSEVILYDPGSFQASRKGAEIDGDEA